MNKYKRLLIESQGYKCDECSISEWHSKPITLELEHIDGNNRNNSLDNLRLLCPNCHSQTSTFRGKNIDKGLRVLDETLLDALQTTDNIRQALIKVGLTPKGANYTRASKLLNLNYDKVVDTKNSQYGTIWVNNGKVNRKIKNDILNDYLALGWIKGRIVNTKPPSQKGRRWVTNGIQNMMSIDVPAGWWLGRC